MKNLLMAIGLLLAGLATRPAQAFLSSSDPDNFFLLLESAPIAASVELGEAQAPSKASPFFLYELKKSTLLRGTSDSATFKVAEEALLPNQKPSFAAKSSSLVFLTPLPDYTAYRALRSRGYDWRIFGGKRGVWPVETTLATAQAYLAASAGAERDRILLKTVGTSASPLRVDAVYLLAQRGPLPLSSEDAATLVAFAASATQSEWALATVKIFESANNEAAIQGLRKLADGPSSSAKWAAIRVLEKKGQSRSVAQLTEDYQGADASGQAQALSLIAAKQDGEALAFFANLIAGPADYQKKHEAIEKMAERKNAGYERLLIQQIGAAKDESLQAAAILALGKMGSSEAVPSILPLVDSPSEKLRGAAFFMLMESPDPRAQALMSQRYERDHHGGYGKNPHFLGNP